ncbi:MAG: hemerythrin family protein [Rhodocyclales bacterium]|jgi:hemerythrin-like metal-binding protein|nr:hemerythrin family protein [Rhodocyclales bacterium]
MPDSIKWNDDMLTGVAEIDAQHRILVDTLIEANTKLTADASDPLFEQITRDLLAYAIYHFDTEEQLMRQCGYAPDDAAKHVGEHRSFSEQVVALRNDARRGEPGARNALVAFLRDWLVNHIMTSDRRLGQFIRAAAPARTPAALHHD